MGSVQLKLNNGQSSSQIIIEINSLQRKFIPGGKITLKSGPCNKNKNCQSQTD